MILIWSVFIVLAIIFTFFRATYAIPIRKALSNRYPHADSALCHDLLDSLTHSPESWEYDRNGKPNYLVHTSKVKLWIYNGYPFFRISEPQRLFIPDKWAKPMWRAIKANKAKFIVPDNSKLTREQFRKKTDSQ